MSATYFGFNPPFIDSKRGVLARQEDAQLIKNDILQLLFTLPGERVHRPEFGTLLRSIVFEPLDEISIDNLRSSIRSAIINNEPRLQDVEVFLSPNRDKLLLEIIVIGNLNYDQNVKLELETAISAPGIGKVANR